MPRPKELGQPSWPAILQGVIEKAQGRVHTALPGRVTAYDVASQTATVQLVVQVDGETIPPLEEVPVAWPGGAAGFLHVPLSAGDTCLVVFSEEDYSLWWASGSISPPEVQQRHGLHAIAIPGLRPETSPFGATSGHVTLAATAALHLGSDTASSAVVLQTSPAAWKTIFDAWVTALPATGVPLTDTAFKAAMQALGTALASGGWPGNFNATKVRAT